MKSNSSPSAPAKSLKPVFREKHRNTGFFLTLLSGFNCNFYSLKCRNYSQKSHEITRKSHEIF